MLPDYMSDVTSKIADSSFLNWKLNEDRRAYQLLRITYVLLTFAIPATVPGNEILFRAVLYAKSSVPITIHQMLPFLITFFPRRTNITQDICGLSPCRSVHILPSVFAQSVTVNSTENEP